MSRPIHPLGFKTDDMPLDQLVHLIEALTTIESVTSGLVGTGQFYRDGNYTSAGETLEHFRCHIGCEIDDIREAAKRRRVTSREEAEHKFDILLSEKTFGADTPSATVAELARLVADMDFELGRTFYRAQQNAAELQQFREVERKATG